MNHSFGDIQMRFGVPVRNYKIVVKEIIGSNYCQYPRQVEDYSLIQQAVQKTLDSFDFIDGNGISKIH